MNTPKGIDLWMENTSWVSVALSVCGVCWLLLSTSNGVVEFGPALLVGLATVLQAAFLIFLVGLPAAWGRQAHYRPMPSRVFILYWTALLVAFVELIVLLSVSTTSMGC